jgi:hypothetical protein
LEGFGIFSRAFGGMRKTFVCEIDGSVLMGIFGMFFFNYLIDVYNYYSNVILVEIS